MIHLNLDIQFLSDLLYRLSSYNTTAQSSSHGIPVGCDFTLTKDYSTTLTPPRLLPCFRYTDVTMASLLASAKSWITNNRIKTLWMIYNTCLQTRSRKLGVRLSNTSNEVLRRQERVRLIQEVCRSASFFP